MNPLFCLAVSLFALAAANPEVELNARLRSTYPEVVRDGSVRPLENGKMALPVQFGFSLINIEGVEREEGVLSIRGWYTMMWKDDYLTWNATTEGVNSLRMPAQALWFPDLTPYNSLSARMSTELMTYVLPSGNVTYIPQGSFRLQCETRGRRLFCPLKIGSWVYSKDQLDLSPYQNATTVDTTYMMESQNWEVERTSLKLVERKYECCPEVFQAVDIELVIVHK